MSKKTGTYYEQVFLVECLKRNLHPHISIGDYLPHDTIVQNSVGRLLRVQIKGTDCFIKNDKAKSGRYRITAARGSSTKEPIDCRLVDVLSAYIAPQGIFYNIPCTDLSSISLWLAPHDPKSRGRYEKYKDNWDVFK